MVLLNITKLNKMFKVIDVKTNKSVYEIHRVLSDDCRRYTNKRVILTWDNKEMAETFAKGLSRIKEKEYIVKDVK